MEQQDDASTTGLEDIDEAMDLEGGPKSSSMKRKRGQDLGSGSSTSQDRASKRGRKGKQASLTPGHEYKPKKAGGDVKRTVHDIARPRVAIVLLTACLDQGMLEPYAYIPLDAKVLGKKQRQEALEIYSGVVSNDNAKGAKGKRNGRGNSKARR